MRSQTVFLSNRAERGTKLADGIKLVSLTTRRDSANSKGSTVELPSGQPDFRKINSSCHKLSVLGTGSAVAHPAEPENQNVSR